MALKFLMSTCRFCGAPAKGKYYRILLILTPFAIIFYSIIVLAFLYVGMTNAEYDNVSGRIATTVGILLFLAPGLFILFLLRRSRGVCDSCMRSNNYQAAIPNRGPQHVAAQVRPIPEREPQLDRSERDAIKELLDNNPSAKEVIDRNSARMPALTLPVAQQVVQATVLEWAKNIEEAAALYESMGLLDEALRVRSKNNISMSTGVKGLERIG